MHTVKHVFFDLDHTLWDFDRNSTLAYQAIFEHNQLTLPIENFLKVYTPVNLKLWKLFREERITKEQLRYNRLKETFTMLNFDASDALILKMADEYLTYLPKNNYLLDNAIEVLNYLQPKYNLHIITNGFETVQLNKLKNSNIIDYFDVIVTSDSVGVKKPNPKIYQYALESASAIAKESVMIGDSIEADIYGALQMDMKAIHIAKETSNTSDSYVSIGNLLELKQYL